MSSTDETTHRGDRDTAAARLGGPSDKAGTARADESTEDDGGARRASGDDSQAAEQKNATLIAPDRAREYQGRWTELKGEFVDEPRRAVRGANELVGEVLDELEALFRRQRDELERDLDNEEASTEDLRLALGRYRSFFDRLLTI